VETDFAYEQLSPELFEQLAVAVAESVIGAGMEVYGRGPDGGREATFTGKINWSATTDDDGAWNGYAVVQAKQCQSLSSDPGANLQWLRGQVRDELKRWMDPKSKRKQLFPQYLLIVTNVHLSATDPGGGIDKIRADVSQWLDKEYDPKDDEGKPRTLRRRGLRDIRVWHRTKLNTLLTQRDGIRKRFAPLVTLGDVLARLERLDELLPGLVPQDHIAGVLHDHAQTTLTGERWVRFDEAGDDFNHQSVERVIFDLPIRDRQEQRSSALRFVLDRGDQVLSPSVPHANDDSGQPPPSHLVITGAPGNGKSTLVKYLTQVYRAAFTKTDANELAVHALIDSTDASLRRLSLNPPHIPRWPLRIDLANMAEAMGPDGGPNLRRYLCDQINLDSKVRLEVANLDDWLKMWPSVLLFDGLDEVTHPALRQRVLREISALLDKAETFDADLFVVITTRPTGYTPLLPERFDQIDLDYFTHEEARDYGRHVTTERLTNDPEYRRATLARFDDAVASTSVERLLTTPLQVLILTVIVARRGPLPTNRYELFWNYYDTVFKREAGKITQLRDFLNRHRTEITDLHQRVGIVLHRLCEATRELRGRMHIDELRGIARDRMIELGHTREVADDMAGKLVTIATHRLVLLSADDDNTVSFDIRSLQELMAGCALVDVAEANARQNLISAACSPHWRNAWLFGAGRLFTGPDHQRRLVLDVVEHCDTQGHWHGWLYPSAPGLAADILDDGLAVDRPHDRRRLIEVVLRVLDGPMPDDSKALAHRLSAATDTVGRHGLAAAGITDDRLLIRGRLHHVFTHANPSHAGYAIAATLVHYGSLGTNIPGQPPDPRSFADAWKYREPSGDHTRLGAYLTGTLQNYDSAAYPPQQLVLDALDECNQLQMIRSAQGNLRPLSTGNVFHCANLHAALNDADAEAEVQIIIETVPADDWPAVSFLAQAYWPTASRWPISELLHVAGDPTPSAPTSKEAL
jgi:energy-coupling factor transporter ATP-binding protein EcfA2